LFIKGVLLRTLSELASYQALLSYIGISLTVSIHILQQRGASFRVWITFLMIARPTCEAHDRFWVKLDCGEQGVLCSMPIITSSSEIAVTFSSSGIRSDKANNSDIYQLQTIAVSP